MLILRLPKENKPFVYQKVRRYRRIMKQGLLLGNVAYSDTAVYFMVPDEALSIAFLYGAYFEAKKKGLNVESMYAVRVDLDAVLPEDVKSIGKKWVRKSLSEEEINKFKNKFITPNLLEVMFK